MRCHRLISDLAGYLAGALTGNLAGALTGNLTGNLAGDRVHSRYRNTYRRDLQRPDLQVTKTCPFPVMVWERGICLKSPEPQITP